ncbi:MAG: hypothetical protein ACXVI2_13375 [Ilumatobacteraceae bacterium]
MTSWVVEQILHFDPGDFVKSGLAHFGFHASDGRLYAISHQEHYVGLVGGDDHVRWTIAAQPVFDGCPNIAADLAFPIYLDTLPDGTLLVSNFGNSNVYRIDPVAMSAHLLIDGHELGIVDMGNCVVDEQGSIWINEVTGCRIWRFDQTGRQREVLGDGSAGFQDFPVSFDSVRFNWIYDIRRGPDNNIYVLDSKNFAVRVIDIAARVVRPFAGTGAAGYSGDGGEALSATFGSDPSSRFDGPISLSVDQVGNVYVGDRLNHVVRLIDHDSGIISTIAGDSHATMDKANDPAERDPHRLNLPMISSMDYCEGRLFVPTDLAGDDGDLIVMRRA